METILNKILEKLKEPLNYKWKPQGQNKAKDKRQCVAYIDSRDVQNTLDSICIWQNEFYEVKGKLFCRIGIFTEDYGTLWRSDSGFLENEHIEDGTESKGEVSDTFKRAAVQWGIGRFLYSKQIQWITNDEYNNNKFKLTEFIEGRVNGGNKPKTNNINQKPFFNEPQLKIFIDGKRVNNYETSEQALKKIRETYKIGGTMEQTIRDLFVDEGRA